MARQPGTLLQKRRFPETGIAAPAGGFAVHAGTTRDLRGTVAGFFPFFSHGLTVGFTTLRPVDDEESTTGANLLTTDSANVSHP